MRGRIGVETITILVQSVFLCGSDISSILISSQLFGYKEYVIIRAINAKSGVDLDE